MTNIFLDRAQPWAYGARMAVADTHEPFLVGRADNTPTEAVAHMGWRNLFTYRDGTVIARGLSGIYLVATSPSGPRARMQRGQL